MHQRSSRCAQALLASVFGLFALSAAIDAVAEDFHADLAPDTELLSFAERQALAVLPATAIRGQNQALLTQNGENNRIVAAQAGQRNVIEAQQQGQHNVAALVQGGYDNFITVQQMGLGNLASIVQGGAGNRAQVAQNGNYNRVEVLQLGQGMWTSIVQNGNHNTTRVIQQELAHVSPMACTLRRAGSGTAHRRPRQGHFSSCTT